MGRLLCEMGQYEDALLYLQRAEERIMTSPRGDSELVFGRELGCIAESTGTIFHSQDRNEEALVSFRYSNARFTALYGKQAQPEVDVACSYNNIGGVLLSLGDLTGAEAELRAAESIFAWRGWKDTESSDLHSNMGALAVKQERHREAIDRFARCLAIRRAVYPGDHPRLAQPLATIASIQAVRGDFDGALATESMAIDIRRRSQVACAAGCKRKLRPDGAPLDQCAGCLRTYYCSVACQTTDWKAGHKKECKALAAEGRAAAAKAKHK